MRSNSPPGSAHRRDAVAAGKVGHQPVADKAMGLPSGRGSPSEGAVVPQSGLCPTRTLRAARLTASTTRPDQHEECNQHLEDGGAPTEIAYVGDRLDNDIRPALAAGMVAVFVRHGPWGYVYAAHSGAARAHTSIESLDELPKRFTLVR
jgi:phosphoglycolate phosphatase-like HAD superfamily hydrolase